jgi:hypothetical protein
MLKEGNDCLGVGELMKRKRAGTTEMPFLTATLGPPAPKFRKHRTTWRSFKKQASSYIWTLCGESLQIRKDLLLCRSAANQKQVHGYHRTLGATAQIRIQAIMAAK